MSFELLNYEPPIEEPQAQRKTGARKYTGENAGDGYRAKREQSAKWQVEQGVIEGMLTDLHPGSWVLDVPCGEGRFFDFYHKQGLIFRGVDVEKEQLEAAATRVKDPMKARLIQGDVRAIPCQDKSVDATVMCRITRWLSPEDCKKAFWEAQRVTRDRIIITARRSGPHARPVSLFVEALLPDWKLASDTPGYEEDYRILMFQRDKGEV